MPTIQSRDHWLIHRANLRKRWWIYLAVSVLGVALFLYDFRSRDPYILAISLLIPLLALRQAWRIDRQIAECDRQMRDHPPIIDSKETT